MRQLFTIWLSGRMPTWFLVGVWGPVLSVLGALLFAASASVFPGGYDWRFDVMCRLGYAHVNPDGSAYWAWALFLVCVMGVPCCRYFYRRLSGDAPRRAGFARVVLSAGLACGMVIALDGLLLPKLNEIFPKLHETVATIAFAAIFFGVLAFWSAMTTWLQKSQGWSAWQSVLLSLLVLVPMAGALVSQA